MITQQKDISSTAKLNDDQTPRIVLIKFIFNVFQLFCLHNKIEWHYCYYDCGPKRNDNVWRILFSLSNNPSFDIKNIWKLYSNEIDTRYDEFKKSIREKVDFDHKHVN